MKRTVLWLLILAIGVSIGIWLLGFWIGGCSSTVSDNITSTTSTPTSSSGSPVPTTIPSGLSGQVSWNWTGYNAVDRWGKLLVAIYNDENFDPGKQVDVMTYRISGESSMTYDFPSLQSGTYYIVGVLYIDRNPLPFSDLQAGDKLGQYSDGSLPIAFGGGTHASAIAYGGGNLPNNNFSLNAIYLSGGGGTTTTTGTTATTITGSWSLVGPAGFSTGSVQLPTDPGNKDFYNLSLSLYHNMPFVAFSDMANGNKATVMKYYNGNWVTVGPAGLSEGQADSTCLSINQNNGDLYLAYSDAAHGGSATVVKYNTGISSWEPLGGVGFTAGQAEYISLNAEDGTLFMAFQDDASGQKISVMKYDAGGKIWNYVGNAGFSAGGPTFYQTQRWLALDNGKPEVCYWDDTRSGKLTVMKYNGADWLTVGDQGFTAGQASSSSIVNYNGTPYVAFTDGSSINGKSYRASGMKYNGGSWDYVGNPGFSVGEGHYPSLFITSDGTMNVAYCEYYYGKKATARRFDGTNWQLLGGNTFSPGTATYLSLVVDSQSGIPYVAFVDGANGYRVSVMSFQ